MTLGRNGRWVERQLGGKIAARILPDNSQERKRGGFVPLGDMAGAVELPGGRVLTPRAAAPQALHHFTRLDQVTQLVRTSEAEADVGFMARLLALCSLPRTNPGDRKEFVRRNGPYTLGMVAGVGNKLPYGTLPRLLLAWVCTEAVRTGRRELVLGRSLAKFMRQIGITNDSGGRRGDRTRLRNQMDRLFAAQVSLIYEDEQQKLRVSSLVRTVRGGLVVSPSPPRVAATQLRLVE